MSSYSQGSCMIFFVIPLALLVVLVWSGPVSAATIDLIISGDIPHMELTPGSSNQNSSVHLNVTSTTPNWTVSVKDASDDSKPPSFAGRMVEWNGTSSAYVMNPAVLGANMTITGANATGSIGSTATLGAANQKIETGTANVTSLDIPITFAQEVTYNDSHLTLPNHVYRIVVTFTGAVT
jgi:hypothetical protein